MNKEHVLCFLVNTIRSVLRCVLFLLDHPGSDMLASSDLHPNTVPPEDIRDPAWSLNRRDLKPAAEQELRGSLAGNINARFVGCCVLVQPETPKCDPVPALITFSVFVLQ